MKRLRGFLLFVIILIGILVWAALGPGMQAYLASRSHELLNELKTRSGGHIVADSVSGDFWSGVTLKHVVVYSDDANKVQVLDADTVVLYFNVNNFLSKDMTPSRILVSGFTATLHIDEDGAIALPKWKFKSANSGGSPVMHAGFAATGTDNRTIGVSCEKGVLSIVKKFPKLPDPVDLSIVHLTGSGKYIFNKRFTIDSLKGDYFSTPVNVSGDIPNTSSQPIDIVAQVGELELSTLFRDLDPLFTGSTYLPNGLSKGEIHLTGSKDIPHVNGTFDISHAAIGNVIIDSAHTAVSYSAGVVDLTNITASAYGGKLEGQGKVNLLSATPLWTMNCKFESVNLGQYLTSNGYYAYELAGGFAGTIDASGDFKNRDKLACKAVSEAKAGTYLSPFSERFMLATQNQKPSTPAGKEDLVPFDDAQIQAEVQNSRIKVSRFHFVSHELQVDATGQLGFDKSINASGTLSVPMDKAKQNRKLGKFVALLPDTMDRVSLQFSLSGLLSNVQFNAQPAANLLQGLLDQGGDLLHNLGVGPRGPANPTH